MRSSLRVLVAGLCCTACVVAAPALAADGSLDVPVKESEAPDAPVTEKLHLYSASKALVIGIDNYGGSGLFASGSGWPKLSMGIKDAEEIAKSLEAKGFKVTLLEDLDSNALKSAMEDFFIRDGADPESRLLIWYAGHGHTINGEGYLVPTDAPNPTKDEIEFRRKALSLRRFGEFMRGANAKHVLAVFDSCFAGTIFEVARALPPRAITRATALKVRQFVSSGDASQTVSDNGRFRRLFIDALDGKEPAADPNGDGFITGSEIGMFLADKITNLSEKGQTPRYGKLIAEGYDRGDFVLEKGAIELPKVAAAPPAPADPQQTAQGGTARSSAADAQAAWALVKDSTSVTAVESFRAQFGKDNPFYEQVASERIAALKIEWMKKEAADREAKEEADRKAREAAVAKMKADVDELERLRITAKEPGNKQDAASAEAERLRVAMLAKEEGDRKYKEAEVMKPGRVFRDCAECPEMVVVPAGEFKMGSEEVNDETPTHTVTIAKPFAVGKFEVTFAEWDACVAADGCKKQVSDVGWGRGRRPVVNVAWNDAQEYVSWLTKKTGKPYHLPTEAEWEYAARAGTTTKYAFGDTISQFQARYTEGNWIKGPKTLEVGSFKPNAFGLYDMHGNVGEWVEDCYKESYAGASKDGSASVSGDCANRIFRGGSYSNYSPSLRSANRSESKYPSSDVGFRVARTLIP